MSEWYLLRAAASHLREEALDGLLFLQRRLTYWNSRLSVRATRLEPLFMDYAFCLVPHYAALQEMLAWSSLPPVHRVASASGVPVTVPDRVLSDLMDRAAAGEWDQDLTLRPERDWVHQTVEIDLGAAGVVRGVVTRVRRGRLIVEASNGRGTVSVSPSRVEAIVY